MLSVIFGLSLSLFFHLTSTVLCLPVKCPDKTIPYPYPHRPDSCYLFLDWKVTSDFWTKVWNRETPGWTYDYDAKKKIQLNLFSSVWDVDQARRICKEIGHHDTEHIKPYKHLRNYTNFRLPIIESADENFWLRHHLLNNESLGTHFWIDLEYEPDKDEHFWHTTGEVMETGHFFPDREEEDPMWEDEFIQNENYNNMFRVCFEFFIDYGGFKLRGWHKRACAQAYTRYEVIESCSGIQWTTYNPYPYTRRRFRRQRAPHTVVCELPLYEEAITTTPSSSDIGVTSGLGKLSTIRPTKKKAARRSIAWSLVYAAFVFDFVLI